jgi:hypothetical protein
MRCRCGGAKHDAGAQGVIVEKDGDERAGRVYTPSTSLTGKIFSPIPNVNLRLILLGSK